MMDHRSETAKLSCSELSLAESCTYLCSSQYQIPTPRAFRPLCCIKTRLFPNYKRTCCVPSSPYYSDESHCIVYIIPFCISFFLFVLTWQLVSLYPDLHLSRAAYQLYLGPHQQRQASYFIATLNSTQYSAVETLFAMGVGSFLEPLIVVTLLFGGAYFNRNKDYNFWTNKSGIASIKSYKRSDDLPKRDSTDSLMSGWSGSRSPSLDSSSQPALRRRRLQVLGYKRIVSTPNTHIFEDRLLSRLLKKLPFLVECWYWFLIYFVYQVGRAITALTLDEGTVDVARRHALQIIHLEQRLHIFWEIDFQKWFLARPTLLHWINRIYSFIHIPGTITFLVVLYYFTTTRHRRYAAGRVRSDTVAAGPALYEARRRTMAMCNLIAFVVFTSWPCMPPRLLSDPEYKGPDAEEAKSFGFVDSVHSGTGESSVWTTNRFCNQYAAMPSLHFGYSLLVGLTVATIPITGLRSTSWKRIIIVAAGMSYPVLILTAIVATANHFILDAVAGAMVCSIAWNCNDFLLNFCILEDYFLSMLRLHKPVNWTDPETAVEPEFQSGLLSEDV
ncbi:hypothetical protein FOXG_07945 [Fusarium oxysporum f. sp. lycopersici 4287]|uniref:Inositolphosphotransferase Aur1/Ipt1 domain-containing protein n=3 Tax=Fusarium oxysporum TaxID=5507 RepID=A0A0J9V3S4_FUSO4|nr:hypothetical protein FOXG_07945 [Fusarium oxysporum f. sp. lycopersici 4287]EXK45383.1 hypothetical protein FOMG_03839 [Fusarium oxysporum f. sp. melonis 26406]KAJ9426606.1 PAP2 superfamily-domain-containing protein [Fusarium oxysporum]KNB05773.1 hypothetical protein FOXG_07945 [Fusarium oxysporum f. sp. lycopersici 4287]